MKRRWYYILAIAFSYIAANIGGAFVSGREIMQFFGQFGSAGFWGVIVAIILYVYGGTISLITACRWQTFNYRSYVRRLYQEFMPQKVASKACWVFEIAYLLFCILIIGVLVAAMASMVISEWEIPYGLGIVISAGLTLVVVTFGANIIRAFNFTITWALLLALAGVLATIFKPICGESWHMITSGVGPGGAAWLLHSVLYGSIGVAFGSMMIISLAEPLKDRFSALTAGLVGGTGIGLLIMFEFVCAMAYYPQIVEEVLPLWFMSSKTGLSFVRFAYDSVLVVAILTSMIACVYPIVKRFTNVVVKKLGPGKDKLSSFLLTLLLILLGLGLSTFGLIPLVAKGLVTLGWVFGIIFVVPLLIFTLKALGGKNTAM